MEIEKNNQKLKKTIYIIKKCSSKAYWNNFVESSPQGNIFATTYFLDAYKEKYDLLFLEKNNLPHLGIIIIKKNKGNLAVSPFLYQGIFFASNYLEMPIQRRIKLQIEIANFLFDKLVRHYKRIAFSLHHSIKDLRSFQWFNYKKPQKGQFKINLYYTGLINFDSYTSFNDYFGKIRKVRRSEFFRAVKKKLMIEESNDISKLDYLYDLTFKRQGIKTDIMVKEKLMKIAFSALSHNFGKLLFCKDNFGKIVSATLFLFDHKYGYYLVGANHPDYRQTGGSTFLMIENIKRCYQQGLLGIDICGINSPNRGDFKTSFNAEPIPYFEVTWKKP